MADTRGAKSLAAAGRPRWRCALVLLAAVACGDTEPPVKPGLPPGPQAGQAPRNGSTSADPDRESPAEAPGEASSTALFLDRTDTGVDFHHYRYTTPHKKYLPETAGSGVAMLDHDADGDLDLYFVQGSPLPGYPGPDGPRPNRLFRNDGDWAFVDVTASAGVGDQGYGMGVTAPDLDNDGYPELYVTNVRANVLYHNQGDGTFADVTGPSGLGDEEWSTAVGWADLDRDGDLDCYLANYAVCEFETYKVCKAQVRGEVLISYCHPDTLVHSPDYLWRNDGDLKFTDITVPAGIVDDRGKGLAVVPFDHDDNGLPDLFVANDSNENFLWINQGGMRFENEADLLGVSVDSRGRSQGCMGTDIGDVDGDGDMDIVSVNFGKEHNVLYLRMDGGFYEDRSFACGLGEPSYKMTGFGAELFDHDKDGDLDFAVVNGHIVDVVEQVDSSQTFLQVPQFFENLGGLVFQEIGSSLGPYYDRPNLGRGMAVGDLDDDGDLDMVVNNNDLPAALLENRAGADRHWIGFSLQGTSSARDAIGARVTVTCGDLVQVEEIRGSTSYLSWMDLRLFFGLADRDQACDVEIRWPSGKTLVRQGLAVDQYHSFVEE